MTIATIMNSIKNIKKGAFTSVEYETVPTILAAYKDHQITKRTKKVVRLGVSYGNIASVIASKQNQDSSVKAGRKNPYTWEIDNIIAKHESGSMYLQIANVPNHSNTSSAWFLDGKQVSFEDVKDYLAPSYLKKSAGSPAIQKIHIENIVKIG